MNTITSGPSTVQGQTGQKNGVVSPKILPELKKELSEKDLISDIHDKRVMDLRDLLMSKGRRFSPDAVKLLGGGWFDGIAYDYKTKVMQWDVCSFRLMGKNNAQEIDCDPRDGNIHFFSEHKGCPSDQTQEIILRKDGVVVSDVIKEYQHSPDASPYLHTLHGYQEEVLDKNSVYNQSFPLLFSDDGFI